MPSSEPPMYEMGLPGLMMDVPLTVQLIRDRMSSVHQKSKVITLLDPETGECNEALFPDVAAAAGRLANALSDLGVRPGDRVASLAWNIREHVEVYLGVMSMGAVLHTANMRLNDAQLAYTINHAQDRVVIVDSELAPQLAAVLPQLTTVEAVIMIDSDRALGVIPTALDYAALLAGANDGYEWPLLDERAAASLCYTSGTTGDPKGVLYSHRSIVLHALAMSGADVYDIHRHDRVLACVPLFHAMGWGLPFVCGLVGSDIILPGRHLGPETLAGLISRYAVTWSAGVPTLWLDLLRYSNALPPEDAHRGLASLRTVICGGTAVPLHLMKEFEEQYGVRIIQGWGMTEIFPGAAVAREEPGDTEEQKWERRRSAGRISPLYEMRIVREDAAVGARDGVTVGEVEVRGPAAASGYFAAPELTSEKFDDGWLRTGDIGTIDELGWLRVTDRLKDVIKSGGEWISSTDLESEIMAHPAVREAAVVAKVDERWGERPVAFVVVDAPVTVGELREHLLGCVARWWVPDDYRFVDSIPRTSTGKFDKKVLGATIANSAAEAVG